MIISLKRSEQQQETTMNADIYRTKEGNVKISATVRNFLHDIRKYGKKSVVSIADVMHYINSELRAHEQVTEKQVYAALQEVVRANANGVAYNCMCNTKVTKIDNYWYALNVW
jgi:hypothetical protein